MMLKMKKFWIFLSLMGILLSLAGCKEEPVKELDVQEIQSQIQEEPAAAETLASETIPSPVQFQGTLIEEQTFEVSLDGWGNVTFASSAPDDSTAGEHGRWLDVRFYLLRDSKPIYEFPGWNEAHWTADRFLCVEAIAFRDYNDDGLPDVITVCKYETEIGNTFSMARVYFQLENRQGFEEDTLLTEYLLKQHCAGTVAAVMSAKEDYWDYLSAMDGHRSAYSQMQVIAENVAMWHDAPDYANEVYRYAVTDLDRNGRYEVTVSNMGGTGQYTYSRFFEVNDSYDGLVECDTPFLEYDSQPDILVEKLDTYINSDGEFYYAVHDLVKNGAAEYQECTSALTLKDGALTVVPIAYRSTIYTEGTPSVTCRDASGAAISEDTYENAVTTYFSEWKKIGTLLGWQDMRELADNTEDILAQLRASFDVYFEFASTQ